MGLAPYGNPIYEDKIKKLVDIKEDGTFRLDQKYFNYATGLTMTNNKFNNLFGQKPRNPKNEKINSISYGYSSINSKSNRRDNDQISQNQFVKNMILKIYV